MENISHEDILRVIDKSPNILTIKVSIPSDVCLYVSSSCEEIIGFSQKEIIGNKLATLIRIEEMNKINEYLEKSSKGIKTPPRNFWSAYKKDGTKINIDSYTIFINNEYAIIQIRDVTDEQKHVEKYNLYSKLLANAIDVAWIIDTEIKSNDLKYIYVSPSSKKMYEIEPEDLQSDYMLKMNCLTPRTLKGMNECILDSTNNAPTFGQYDGNYITPITKQKRRLRWCWNNEKLENGIIRAYGTTSDITKECDALNQITRIEYAKEVAEVENKKKRSFLENICHEQRNLHMGISGGSEMAMDFITELENDIEENSKRVKKMKDIVSIIADSSVHINHLLDTTLSLQQMESEHYSYTYDFHDMAKTIDSCTKKLSHLIKTSKITFLLEIEKQFKNLLIRYDNTKIIQAIMNLISNAFKYTDKGIVKLNVNCELKKDEIKINISIEDTGIGIEEEKIKMIFELYKQINTLRGGSGIGLYLVKKFIEDGHNGKLNVESKYGHGSKFTLSFPCQYKYKSNVENYVGLHSSIFNLDHRDILLVEDMHSNRILIGTMLMNLGYHYDESCDGIEALEKYKNSKYDIVLTDRKMPNMDGIKLTKELLKINQNQIIIGITGNSIKEQVDEWLDIGAKDIITKPCSKIKIKEVLHKYVRPIVSSGSGI